MTKISTIGLDLAKNVFQVHGIDASGATSSGSAAGDVPPPPASRGEQIAQVIEPVAPGKPREVSERLSDEACGFVGTALARRLTRRRRPLSRRRFLLLPLAPGPAHQRQNPCISI